MYIHIHLHIHFTCCFSSKSNAIKHFFYILISNCLFVVFLCSFFCFFNLTLSFVFLCTFSSQILSVCLSLSSVYLFICLSSFPASLTTLFSAVCICYVFFYASIEYFLRAFSLCIFFHVSFMYFPLCICYVFFFFVSSSAIIWVFYVISSRYFCLISEVCILFI